MCNTHVHVRLHVVVVVVGGGGGDGGGGVCVCVCACGVVIRVCARACARVHVCWQAAMWSACTKAKLHKSHCLDKKMQIRVFHEFWPKNQTRSEHFLRAWDLPSPHEIFEVIIGIFQLFCKSFAVEEFFLA